MFKTKDFDFKEQKNEYSPPYGDVTQLNTCRLIMDSVGTETLNEIGRYAIQSLKTSVAVYEANGDYAYGLFSSSWCQIMDLASRELCGTNDNKKALSCGKWLCHENCWNDSAKKAIETGKSTDIECVGGIRLYAEPIYAGPKVIGAINIGYGEPPKAPEKLKALGELFEIDPEQLETIGRCYKPRPDFTVGIAKNLLKVFAKLIGEIVEKEEAKKILAKVTKRNQALLDYSPACHKIVDLDFNLQYMNAQGFKMLGLEQSHQVYGKPYPFEFFPLAFRDGMLEKLGKVKHTGKSLTFEAMANDIDGNEVWLNSFLIPVFNDERDIKYITVVTSDTTQEKNNEKVKEKLEAQLRQAQKLEAVGRLAGGVAHDFNNMLTVIQGNTEMAKEEVNSSHPLSKNLIQIEKATQRSTGIIRQLLAFARKQTIAPKVLQLNETIEEMLKMLRRLIGENIELSWNPGTKLWPIKIDSNQIDQVLANLAVNARDAISNTGKLTVETKNVIFDNIYCAVNSNIKPGEFVALSVTDNGCGMDSEAQKNIFEPFFTTKEMGKGTGLGLATVYGIVKQNNGFINVYSEPGIGTTFNLYLPRHKMDDVTAPTKKDDTIDLSGNETILVVEDETDILQMLRMMLEKFGYNVLAVTSPRDAIHLSTTYRQGIDLLLTDVIMPEMNGHELARELLSKSPSIKCLYMSGYTENIIATNGILKDGVNFIPKPFSRKALLTQVRRVLDSLPHETTE
jgi:PAS domain S-box-containing protein